MKIEKGISIPVPLNRTGLRATLRAMTVGDSVFYPRRITVLSNPISIVSAQTGFRFTCRTVTENGVPGCRIWRIA